jgi:uncharacterized protein YbjT (DUF2867 family)
MQSKTAAIIGATGLIGSSILNQLLKDPHYLRIKAIVRRPLDLSHPKLETVVIDFADVPAYAAAIAGSEVVFCAVGTTQQKVKGDKEAYRKVDYDIPVNAAKHCATHGVEQFLLVSSVGADSKAGNFYLKLKGEVEDAVRAMSIPSVSIFRPSMLLGNRQESRPAERVGQAMMSALSFLIPSKYKAISGEDVAKAMIAQSKEGRAGVNIYHYAEMKAALQQHLQQ